MTPRDPIDSGRSGPDPVVLAVATASPPHRLSQCDLRAFARRMFADDFAELDQLLTIFDNTGIHERQLACPMEWYEAPRPFAEKNEVYRAAALELATRAASEALARAGLAPADIGAIVFVSSSGIATPSLDSALIPALDLPRNVARAPLWGLGCAGGASGLARAAELVRARGAPVLLVAVEICSVTFVHSDRSKSNLVATSLFGDGAAAAVLACEGEGPRLLASHSQLLDDTQDVMGWTLTDDGLRVRFARSIPSIVSAMLPQFCADAAAAAGIEPAAIEHLVLHPGGAKVLAAYEDELQVPRARLQTAWDVLRDHGNMSSPTLLFVLERFLQTTPTTRAPGLAVALGPGFSAEGMIFRW